MNRNIDLESARKAAWELFKARHGHTDFYGDPETGKIELRFAGELPPDGYEWINSWDEGYIDYNQDMCETEAELENAFNHFWENYGPQFITDMEIIWQVTRDEYMNLRK